MREDEHMRKSGSRKGSDAGSRPTRRTSSRPKRAHAAAAPTNPQRTLLIVVLLGIIVLLIIAIAFASVLKNNASSTDDTLTVAASEALDGANDDRTAQAEEETEPSTTRIKVTFAGDCTLGTDENFDKSRSFNQMFDDVDDPAYFLQNVKPIFEDDDLTVVNMEGTLTTSRDRQDKKFAFKGAAEYAEVFSTSSVETASMANNHSKDYGSESYEDTLEALDAAGIQTFGYDRIAYLDIKGVKVALIGVYELALGEGIEPEMLSLIEEAKNDDAVLTMVYFHWGDEREYVPNETQMKLGHAAIDAGADLVVGSHPHVIQGWEVYEGRYIVYSLGNFCFGGNSNPTDKDCMIFQQTFTIEGDTVEKTDDVEFIACSISSVSDRNNYQPTPATGDEKDRIEAKIRESTEAIAAL